MERRLSQRALWAEGQPISDLMARALANPQLISLAAGFVDTMTLPTGLVREAFDELWSDAADARASLQYGTTHGLPELRELIMSRTQALDGPHAVRTTEPDQVVITAGSNQLLHLVADTLLDPGDIVLTASPTYLVFLGTLHNVGARAYGVAADEQGMIPQALDDALARLEELGLLPRVKAIYLVPYFDNPCGATMPASRREEVVNIARRWSRRHTIYVLSDNAYRELRYGGADEPSTYCFDEEHRHVVETGTFSKSFSPGIRVGWGIFPTSLVEPVCHQKGNIDFGSPNFAQHLMSRVLAGNGYAEHVDRLRGSYNVKLQAMLTALQSHLASLPGVRWRVPRGGLYVWLELPDHVDTGPSGSLIQFAMQEGVLYVPGQYCYPAEGEPISRHALRLSFGVQSVEGIERGIQALSRAVRRVLEKT